MLLRALTVVLLQCALFSVTAGADLKSPEDRKLSPYTGYTRAHWLEITEQLIAGALPYFDVETGIPSLRGVPTETGHFERVTRGEVHTEAFDRILMLAAIYTAATGKDNVPGYDGSITKPFLKGIIQGTDPDSPHFRGPHAKYSPSGSNIAMAVLLSPKFFWEPLNTTQQRNLLAYIQGLVAIPAYDNNHWYFHLMGVPMLEKYGQVADRDRATQLFQRLLNWHRGNGWFIDGSNRGFDYYNLWGFYLYNNALTKFDPIWNEKFGERVRHLNSQFEKSFVYLYGRDGGPIPWGRSLTYRFGSISGLGYAVLNNASTLPPGQARRIASGCLQHFWDHDSLSENGLLEAGYYGPNSAVAEIYMARGSQYWAVQGLIPLVLPESHPFWTETEQPMPADGAGGRMALPGPQMVVRVSPKDGEARLYPIGQPFVHFGQWERGVKYFQHAYSSYLGFAVPGVGGTDPGAGRTGVSYDGVNWHYRENPRAIRVDPYHCVSTYDIQLDSLDPTLNDYGEVLTHTLIGEDGEVHVFWHTSARPVYMFVGGYSIQVPHDEGLRTHTGEKSLLVHSERNYSFVKLLEGPAGDLQSEVLQPRDGWQHSHLFGGKGAYPYWRTREPVPPNTPVVVYVNGTRDRQPPDPTIEVSYADGQLYIEFEGVRRMVRIPH